jgi:hypothetical protein
VKTTKLLIVALVTLFAASSVEAVVIKSTAKPGLESSAELTLTHAPHRVGRPFVPLAARPLSAP